MSDMMGYVHSLADEVGPRPANTEEEHQGAIRIADWFKSRSADVAVEEFGCPTWAEWPLLAAYLLMTAAAALSFIRGVWAIIFLVLSIVALAAFVYERYMNGAIADHWKKGISQNVVARYVPPSVAGDPRRRKVIVVAHYDTSRTSPQYGNSLIDSYPALQKVMLGIMIAIPVLLIVQMLPFLQSIQRWLWLFTCFLAVFTLVAGIMLIVGHFASAYCDGANNNASGVSVMTEVYNRLVPEEGDEADAFRYGDRYGRPSYGSRPGEGRVEEPTRGDRYARDEEHAGQGRQGGRKRVERDRGEEQPERGSSKRGKRSHQGFNWRREKPEVHDEQIARESGAVGPETEISYETRRGSGPAPAEPQPPYGEAAYEEPPYGEAPGGERPYDEPPYGEDRYGEAPRGERSHADETTVIPRQEMRAGFEEQIPAEPVSPEAAEPGAYPDAGRDVAGTRAEGRGYSAGYDAEREYPPEREYPERRPYREGQDGNGQRRRNNNEQVFKTSAGTGSVSSRKVGYHGDLAADAKATKEDNLPDWWKRVESKRKDSAGDPMQDEAVLKARSQYADVPSSNYTRPEPQPEPKPAPEPEVEKTEDAGEKTNAVDSMNAATRQMLDELMAKSAEDAAAAENARAAKVAETPQAGEMAKQVEDEALAAASANAQAAKGAPASGMAPSGESAEKYSRDAYTTSGRSGGLHPSQPAGSAIEPETAGTFQNGSDVSEPIPRTRAREEQREAREGQAPEAEGPHAGAAGSNQKVPHLDIPSLSQPMAPIGDGGEQGSAPRETPHHAAPSNNENGPLPLSSTEVHESRGDRRPHGRRGGSRDGGERVNANPLADGRDSNIPSIEDDSFKGLDTLRTSPTGSAPSLISDTSFGERQATTIPDDYSETPQRTGRTGAFDHLPTIESSNPLEEGPVSGSTQAKEFVAGTFAAGGTGAFVPISNSQPFTKVEQIRSSDIIDDADDSNVQMQPTVGDFASPSSIDIPESRGHRFMDNISGIFSHKKKHKDEVEQSASEWLGVDEDYNATRAGEDIGSWDNFNEDDDWKGGAAYHPGTYEDDRGYPAQGYPEGAYEDPDMDDPQSTGRIERSLDPGELRRQARTMVAQDMLDKELWFVALGAHGSANAGMKAFLKEHAEDLRGSIIINLDCVGAGEICYLEEEGVGRSYRSDHRVQVLIRKLARELGGNVEIESLKWTSTDATVALRAGYRAITIMGFDRKAPVAWNQKGDTMEVIEPSRLELTADLLTEVIRGC